MKTNDSLKIFVMSCGILLNLGEICEASKPETLANQREEESNLCPWNTQEFVDDCKKLTGAFYQLEFDGTCHDYEFGNDMMPFMVKDLTMKNCITILVRIEQAEHISRDEAAKQLKLILEKAAVKKAALLEAYKGSKNCIHDSYFISSAAKEVKSYLKD